jgi:retinol dehydrogenase 12
MSDPKTADMKSRYFDSKLLEVLYCRSLANAISQSPKKPAITLNFLNPGFCHSELYRGGTVGIQIMLKILARSTEEGSRTLVNAVEGGKDTHGEYLSDCKIAMVSNFVLSKEGKETQTRLWEELNEKLEKIEPGITGNI